MTHDFTPLVRELSACRAAGVAVPLWWRDDDAIEDGLELQMLLQLAEAVGMAVHLAVIPQGATSALAKVCAGNPHVVPVVHGWAHRNHAPQGQKKAEFGHPRAAALAEAGIALERLEGLFGDSLFPMFVPPWNRIDTEIVTGLSAQGYAALSTFTPRPHRLAAPGLVQINTHIDPIFWKAGGGLVAPDTLIAGIASQLRDRREGRSDAAEPLGLLTHHLVHDTSIWEFTAACLDVLLAGGATPCNLRRERSDLP